jgi:hypothetical protein
MRDILVLLGGLTLALAAGCNKNKSNPEPSAAAQPGSAAAPAGKAESPGVSRTPPVVLSTTIGQI